MEVEYYSNGRMKYTPEYHDKHAKGYKISDLIYICENYRRGKRKQVALAVGRTESAISQLVCELRKSGQFDYYKELGKNL